ncbi:lipocalin-like protein [Gillisia mitskevichiae]|uniref:Lipocalin-like protein n=1 Tax=Gillisia mitskevichiae TaxID=270921 RepID=A0A495PU99_9FLAO|nr:lipocalin family protein [Gillisia mitskevichiae]RKS53556.1 lipocalin-like protein [Gillisia mitskevichiae]
MKKIFLLFFSLTLLSSCTSDDDSGNAGDDQILGKWYVAEINNSGTLNLTVSECNKQSFIDFNADNNADSAFYTVTDGECELKDSDNSAWSNEGNSRYKFTIPFEGIGSQAGRVEFNESSSFTFYPDLLSGQNTNIVFEKR